MSSTNSPKANGNTAPALTLTWAFTETYRRPVPLNAIAATVEPTAKRAASRTGHLDDTQWTSFGAVAR